MDSHRGEIVRLSLDSSGKSGIITPRHPCVFFFTAILAPTEGMKTASSVLIQSSVHDDLSLQCRRTHCNFSPDGGDEAFSSPQGLNCRTDSFILTLYTEVDYTDPWITFYERERLRVVL